MISEDSVVTYLQASSHCTSSQVHMLHAPWHWVWHWRSPHNQYQTTWDSQTVTQYDPDVSSWHCHLSHASLAKVLPWISWNCYVSTAPKITDNAFALNFDALHSGSDQSSFGFGFFPSHVTMVGTSQPISTAVHASSLIPQINCFMWAFQWPYWSAFNMIAFCIETIVSISTLKITPVI